MNKEEIQEEIQNENTAESTENISETQSQETFDTENEVSAEEKPNEDKTEKELKEWQDKYMRLYSEFENFRRRTAKERLELINNAGEDTIKAILPILDDMNRAIVNNEKSEDLKAVKEGFTLIQHKLSKVFESKGVKKMDALHQPFDAEIHEALTKIPAPKSKLKGKIVDVIEDGYTLNGKVVRFAKVVVGE